MERVVTVAAVCAAVSILAAWPGTAVAARTIDYVAINDGPPPVEICPGDRIQVQMVVTLSEESSWGSTAYKVGDDDWVCVNHHNYDFGDAQPVDVWFDFFPDQTGPLDLVIRAYAAEDPNEPGCEGPYEEVAIPAAIVVLDADGDGVCDPNDLCPETPECADPVDPNGCPSDSDGDGVVDGCDQCPDTPECAVVDTNGCPSDSDGDGVVDGCDQCPDTPECAVVDTNGCPSDSDGDGVVDGCDQCPDTPECAVVDDDGCPIDSDGDDVADGCDQCPDTPDCADPVDADGCPSDSDGDGVVDGCDLCPETAANDPVDNDGCSTADDDDDGVTNDDDLCPDTPACATAVDADGCGIDANGDDIIDGCEPPPQEIPDDLRCCCGETGSVSVLGLAVGLLLMNRFGYRRRS